MGRASSRKLVSPFNPCIRDNNAGRKAMADHNTLETSVQALLVKLAHATDTRIGERIAGRTSYCDAAIDVADFRANPSDEAALTLAKSAEHLLCDLDDLSMSDSPEWQATSLAVDPYVK
jgi:hypothetical protein